MNGLRSYQQKLANVRRHWKNADYDLALADVDALLDTWPGNSHLYILKASLIQLQENPNGSLNEAKKALQDAVELDKESPAAAIELGHFLDAVEDDPKAAAKSFANAVQAARVLLIESLLGKARTLLQLKRRDDAIASLMEAIYLVNLGEKNGAANGSPDIMLRDTAGHILAVQVKGPFAVKVEDLLEELFPKRSA